MGLVLRKHRLTKIAQPLGRPRVRLAALEREVQERLQAILERQAQALGVEVEELVGRLGPDRLDDLLTLLDWEGAWEEPLRRELARITGQVVAIAGQAEVDRLGLSLAFDLDNPRALQHAREYIPELVREVTDSTREAIRDRMAAGFEEGRTARQIGRQIRDVVGLTSRQAAAVGSLRTTLEERGLPAAQVDRQVERMHQRQIRQRALLISRTETIRAFNTGQQAAWEQSASEGHIDAAAAKRFWISSKPVTQGGRTCEVCDAIAAHNSQGVGLSEPFRLPTGGTIDMPPAHPACRCSVGVRFS